MVNRTGFTLHNFCRRDEGRLKDAATLKHATPVRRSANLGKEKTGQCILAVTTRSESVSFARLSKERGDWLWKWAAEWGLLAGEEKDIDVGLIYQRERLLCWSLCWGVCTYRPISEFAHNSIWLAEKTDISQTNYSGLTFTELSTHHSNYLGNKWCDIHKGCIEG